MKLSRNFSLQELTKSQTAEYRGIDNTPNEEQIESLKALCENILQPVREHFLVPFAPSSGFRSPELCLAIGSKITSQHAKGEACDFEIPLIDNCDLAYWIKDNLDFDQLILECYKKGEPTSGWVHCSYVGKGNRKQILTYSNRKYSLGLPYKD